MESGRSVLFLVLNWMELSCSACRERSEQWKLDIAYQ